jgi:hypothetical protein
LMILQDRACHGDECAAYQTVFNVFLRTRSQK